MTSILLEDEAFKGKGLIERKKILEFRIRGLAEVEKDLKDYDGWDGVAKLACVALRLDGQGNIFQDILHLVGSTEPKRFDAKVIFGKDYKQDGHQVKKYDFKKIRYVALWQMNFCDQGVGIGVNGK